MSILTEADRVMLPRALRQNGGFGIATKWYLRGWEPLPYQYAFHHAPQLNVTFLAGIATGKSAGCAASNFIDCISIPYFHALNTSITAKQAEIPFEMIMGWIEDNKRVEHLIEDISLRPYPTIKFANGSEYVFRTAGTNARFIRGHEFDRINYDECGLDFVGEAAKVLRGRLRGKRVNGITRMARLDTITSPTDAPWLKERFDKGDPNNPERLVKKYLSIRATTFDNTHLTKEQVDLMVAEYTQEMIDVELLAKFPDYGMSMFPKGHINQCVNQSLNDAMEMAVRPEDGRVLKGYAIAEHPRFGITKFEMPANPGGLYILAGDPGTDGPPRRNSGVVFVIDYTNPPGKVVYFDWVDGKGSYTPFLQSYKYAIDKYRPVFKGLDTTGTQKAIDELAFENHGIEVDGINFSRDKEAILNSLSLAITNHDIRFPVIQGLIRQLSLYSREDDKKLAQDIVMALGIGTFLMRFTPEPDISPEGQSRHAYRNRSRRTSGKGYRRRR